MRMSFNSTLSNSKTSFKQQLLLLFFASFTCLAITTSVITAWQTSIELRKSTIETGLQISNNLADRLILALLTGSKENASDAINNALGFKSVDSISVYKEDATMLVYSSKNESRTASVELNRQLSSLQLYQETKLTWTFFAPVKYLEERDDIELTEPEESIQKEQVIGYVLLEYNKQALHAVQYSIVINNIVIAAILSLLLSLLMLWFLNRLTKPLLRLSQTMAQARDSGHYTNADVCGPLEVQQMASIYNQMMTTLGSQNLALEKNRDTLESEVAYRTKELVVARDAALAASRLKSEFLANVSHELRTPLQAIIGYTDLVREDLELECMTLQAEDLNKSIRSAHILLALINNILDLAKIEAGKMDLNIKSVEIKNLVDETIETVKPMADANENKLLVVNTVEQQTLNLDRQKVMQILLNLLSNACKFTANGHITFTISTDDNFLHIIIADTGVGIAQDKLKFIFDKFTQIDGSQTRKFEGTGLGMAITQKFCALMLAELTVESELTVGTTVKVAIPINE
jgi:signal transduction histidine kinase